MSENGDDIKSLANELCEEDSIYALSQMKQSTS